MYASYLYLERMSNKRNCSPLTVPVQLTHYQLELRIDSFGTSGYILSKIIDKQRITCMNYISQYSLFKTYYHRFVSPMLQPTHCYIYNFSLLQTSTTPILILILLLHFLTHCDIIQSAHWNAEAEYSVLRVQLRRHLKKSLRHLSCLIDLLANH